VSQPNLPGSLVGLYKPQPLAPWELDLPTFSSNVSAAQPTYSHNDYFIIIVLFLIALRHGSWRIRHHRGPKAQAASEIRAQEISEDSPQLDLVATVLAMLSLLLQDITTELAPQSHDDPQHGCHRRATRHKVRLYASAILQPCVVPTTF
jgi:hypothetical protein